MVQNCDWVFYLGIVGIVWCVIWFIFAKNYPHESKSISRDELMYIQSNVKSVGGGVEWVFYQDI